MAEDFLHISTIVNHPCQKSHSLYVCASFIWNVSHYTNLRYVRSELCNDMAKTHSRRLRRTNNRHVCMHQFPLALVILVEFFLFLGGGNWGLSLWNNRVVLKKTRATIKCLQMHIVFDVLDGNSHVVVNPLDMHMLGTSTSHSKYVPNLNS